MHPKIYLIYVWTETRAAFVTIIAFDRTLPNLLGGLLSCRCPVHVSESWPVFFRSMVQLFGAILNDVTLSLRKTFCLVLRCLSVWEGSSFIILHRASLFVGRFKLYCCLVGKLFCYVVKKFRRCNLSKPEESVCHFWTLYINQNVFCFERFAMFDRTDPLWSQIKSAK